MLSPPPQHPQTICYDARGRYLACARESTITLHDPLHGHPLRDFPHHIEQPLLAVAFLGDQLLVVDHSLTLTRWNLRDGSHTSHVLPIDLRDKQSIHAPRGRAWFSHDASLLFVPTGFALSPRNPLDILHCWELSPQGQTRYRRIDCGLFTAARDVIKIEHVTLSHQRKLLAASIVDESYLGQQESWSNALSHLFLWTWPELHEVRSLEIAARFSPEEHEPSFCLFLHDQPPRLLLAQHRELLYWDLSNDDPHKTTLSYFGLGIFTTLTERFDQRGFFLGTDAGELLEVQYDALESLAQNIIPNPQGDRFAYANKLFRRIPTPKPLETLIALTPHPNNQHLATLDDQGTLTILDVS